MKRLIIMLPDRPLDHGVDVPWWLVDDGQIITAGFDGGWREYRPDDLPVSAMAPAGSARIELVDADTIATPQARTAARLAMVDRAIGDAETLHSALGTLDDGRGMLALVDKQAMADWLSWARQQDLDIKHIFPAASLIPIDGKWHEAKLSGQVMVGRDGLVFLESPELMAALVGDDFVDTMDKKALEESLIQQSAAPTVELRSGPFSYAKPWRVDPSRLKEFAILIGLILLVWLLIPITQAVRYSTAADHLDTKAATMASEALGREVTADQAESALLAAGGTGLLAGDALAALLSALQNEGLVQADALGWAGSGQVSATLSAPDEQALNRLVDALQRDGWTISSTPNATSNGRASISMSMGGAS